MAAERLARFFGFNLSRRPVCAPAVDGDDPVRRPGIVAPDHGPCDAVEPALPSLEAELARLDGLDGSERWSASAA